MINIKIWISSHCYWFHICTFYFEVLPGNVHRPLVKKNSSQSSFDWNFSAPSSPTLPKVVIEDEFEDDNDEGLTFNFDNKEVQESADILKENLTRDLLGSPDSNMKNISVQNHVGMIPENNKKR